MLWSCPFLAACRDVSVLNYQFFLHFVFVICEQKGRLNAPPFYIHHAQSSMGSDNNVSRTPLYLLRSNLSPSYFGRIYSSPNVSRKVRRLQFFRSINNVGDHLWFVEASEQCLYAFGMHMDSII